MNAGMQLHSTEGNKAKQIQTRRHFEQLLLTMAMFIAIHKATHSPKCIALILTNIQSSHKHTLSIARIYNAGVYFSYWYVLAAMNGEIGDG